jgi:hypothetical protein
MAAHNLMKQLAYGHCWFLARLRICFAGIDWRQMYIRLLAIALAFTPVMVHAAGAVYAKVAHVRVDRNGWGIIEFALPISGTPAACRSAPYLSHFSFDSNTAGGKALYAMALSASASGKFLLAYGTGACSEYAGIVESMSYGVTYDQ